MEGELLKTIKNLSWESLGVALLVFILTLFLKQPIKKLTNQLSEEKRKAVNSVILLIPFILSLIFSILYYGLFKNIWFGFDILDITLSSFILSLSFYAIYNRIVILVKGIFSGNVKINSDLTKETIKALKEDINIVTSKIKADEKSLDNVNQELVELSKIKGMLEAGETILDIASISKTNIQIQELNEQQELLQKKIEQERNELNSYKNKLYN